MHSKQEPQDYDVGGGALGNKIKFLLILVFIVVFAYAMFSAVGETSGIKEGTRKRREHQRAATHPQVLRLKQTS